MTQRKKGKAKATNATGDAKAVEAREIAGNAVEAQDAIESTIAGFPIVGIGASAGGLAAFEAFFSGMPVDIDPGMAFVLVQHLAPDHKSILAELVRRYTRMQVFEVEDGMAVKPNCAYIIPPNRDMAFLNGSLQLMEPSAPRGIACPSTSSSVPWPRTRASGASASSFRAPAATAPRACGPSRARGA